jgi:hypothetical protein
MIGRLVKAGLIAAVIAVAVKSMPDIKRYMRMREM